MLYFYTLLRQPNGYDLFGTEQFSNRKDAEVYKHEKGLLDNVTKNSGEFEGELKNFKNIYMKKKSIYIRIKTDVPSKLIAALHYRESGPIYYCDAGICRSV
ncbi:hypothetical protein D3C81_793240 [compost metagenome]